MKAKVLVVEDNPVIARLWSNRLSKEGYTVEVAENGRLARAAVTKDRPDAVLLDIMLPDMDGLSLCREWKSESGFPEMVVICVSAFSARSDRDAALAAGADSYVAKTPAAAQQLVKELSLHLAERMPQHVQVGG
ncbi:MAG: response regulator [Armatimonadetes bacterium]|nr:response regulator [Armatimonadota bacterium]